MIIVAKTLVVSGDGRIVFLRRSLDDVNRPGEWDFPGGRVEPGEDITQTAIREADEEAGLNLSDSTLIYGKARLHKGRPMLSLFFVAFVADKPAITLSHEYSEYCWWTIDEALEHDDYAMHQELLRYCAATKLLENSTSAVTTCRALITNSQGEILIIRRSATDPLYAGTWDIPGGRRERGETLLQAVRRETQEEVGIALAKPEAVYAVSKPRDKGTGTWIFFAEHTAQPVVLGDEHDEYKWIALAELPRYTDYDVLLGMQQYVAQWPGILQTQ